MALTDVFGSRSARPAVDPWSSEAVRWARRMSQAPYKSFIRELAGLSDNTLAAIEAQMRAVPRLAMPRAWRFAVGSSIGMAITGIGLLVLGLEARRIPGLEDADQALQFGGAALLAASMVAAITCALMHMRRAPAMRTYQDLVTHVATLDEQHPWLYETLETARQADAEAYRLKTLAMRGALRGVDLPMMRLVMAAQAEVLRSRTANEVVHALQSGINRTVPADAAVTLGDDSRLPALPLATAEALGVDEAGSAADVSDTGEAAEGGTLLHFPMSESGATPSAASS